MHILGIDTSTNAEGIGLFSDGRVIDEENHAVDRNHSQQLLTGVRTLLDRSGLAVGRLDGFAVAAGPGSFTGVRIGLATVQGLALAGGRPAVAISTLELLAHWAAADWSGLIVAWMDAGRGEVYTGTFQTGVEPVVACGPERVVPADAALADLPDDRPILFVGEGAGRYSDRLRRRGTDGDRIVARHPFLGGVAAQIGATRMKTPGDARQRLRPNHIRRPDTGRNRSDA